jgi:hypothetical protein
MDSLISRFPSRSGAFNVVTSLGPSGQIVALLLGAGWSFEKRDPIVEVCEPFAIGGVEPVRGY